MVATEVTAGLAAAGAVVVDEAAPGAVEVVGVELDPDAVDECESMWRAFLIVSITGIVEEGDGE